MCEEADEDLTPEVLGENNTPDDLGEAIRRRFAALGGVELDISPREPMREPPDFGE